MVGLRITSKYRIVFVSALRFVSSPRSLVAFINKSYFFVFPLFHTLAVVLHFVYLALLIIFSFVLFASVDDKFRAVWYSQNSFFYHFSLTNLLCSALCFESIRFRFAFSMKSMKHEDITRMVLISLMLSHYAFGWYLCWIHMCRLWFLNQIDTFKHSRSR